VKTNQCGFLRRDILAGALFVEAGQELFEPRSLVVLSPSSFAEGGSDRGRKLSLSLDLRVAPQSGLSVKQSLRNEPTVSAVPLKIRHG
jgi:hypothetical protein